MESFLLSSSSPTTPFSHSLSKRCLFFKSPLSISLSLPSCSPSTLRSSSSTFFFFPSKPNHSPIQASSSSKPTQNPNSDPNPNPQGAKLIPLVISVAVGVIVRFLVPKPVEVSLQAWQLLSIFLSTIAGLVLSPLPIGAWAFLGLTVSIVTRTLSFATAFGVAINEVIWLIVISFFFVRDSSRPDWEIGLKLEAVRNKFCCVDI